MTHSGDTRRKPAVEDMLSGLALLCFVDEVPVYYFKCSPIKLTTYSLTLSLMAPSFICPYL